MLFLLFARKDFLRKVLLQGLLDIVLYLLLNHLLLRADSLRDA